MENYRKIIENINLYYPKNCSYEDKVYKNTEEYKRYKTVMKDMKLRDKVNKKVYEIMQYAFPDNYIKEWRNTDYPSVHFSVLLHKNQPILDDDQELLAVLNGRRLDLEVYVSLLDNCYYIYVIETLKRFDSNKWDFHCYDAEEFVNENEMKILTNKLSLEWLSKIDRSIAHKIVPDIETELHYKGEVKVFHCLFSDIEKMF